MSDLRRRQRHKPLLFILLSACAGLSALLLIGQPASCQSTLQFSQYSHHHHHHNHHNHRSSAQQQPSSYHNNNNLILVSGEQQSAQQLAQSLPLIRLQQQQQSADLDNVIESTTLSMISSLQSSSKSASLQQQQAGASCQLPPTWTGRWYQSNKEPIRVTNTEISDKGICRDQKGDKFLFEYAGNNRQQQQQSQSGANQQQQQPCLVCLVINERHLNVLQYKESSCQPIPANYFNRTTNQIALDEDHSLLDSVCNDITGDAQLESLFRLDTPAIECPINGQYSFTYDSCREPQSSLDSCIDKKQLNFKFSACPDVPGSESKSEVLKCYADWSEGNNYYMIGRFEHASNHQDKGKFRCFVYERSADGKIIQMAQSQEESCYGLINANEGPKTLRLTPKPPTAHKCHFPAYIQNQSENWLSVDNSLIYMFNQNSTRYQVKETKEGNVIEEATCLQQFTYPQAHTHPHQQHLHQHAISSGGSNQQAQQVITNRRFSSAAASSYAQADQSFQQVPSKSTANDVVYLVQITKNCHTTNYCVRFYKRSNGIVQIDYFISSPNSDNQCRNAFIGTPQTQIITSTNLEHQRCPFEGAYTIEASIESDLSYNPSNIFICPRQSFLTAQCDHPSRLTIHSRCSPAKFFTKNLHCLGSWTTNGLVRLLLADDDRQRYSAWYKDYGTIQMPSDGASAAEAQALQLQQPAITRSQQLIAASSSQQQQYLANSLAPIVDLQIALITPLPVVTKPMQVRLTRTRQQCSDLRPYLSQNHYISSPMSPIPSYASSTTASSSAPAFKQASSSYYYSISSMLIVIVTLLLHHVGVDTRVTHI